MLSFEDCDRLVAWWHQSGSPEVPDSSIFDSYREHEMDQIERNPLFEQYVRHINRRERNLLPWHAVGELLYVRALLWEAGSKSGVVKLDLGSDHDEVRAQGLAALLRWAQPYLLSNKCMNIIHSCPVPRCVVSRDVLPFPLCFFSMETAHQHGDVETNWFVLRHCEGGIEILKDVLPVGEPGARDVGTITCASIPYGEVYPDFYVGNESALAGVGEVLGVLGFIASPFVDSTQKRLERSLRRDMERCGVDRDEREKTVSVVVLRREAATECARHAEAKIEWKHQWWVSGHMRAQWCPSTKSHKVMWIAPYLKGPPDKPVLEKVYAVVR